MGKAKKIALKKRPHKQHSKPSKPSTKAKGGQITKRNVANPFSHSVIPFQPTDRILLVGEGDFSFSHALLKTHDCSLLLATSFDTHPIVLAKYPQAASTLDTLKAAQEKGSSILYGVDATKIGTGRAGSGGKAVKKGGFDRIVFNFPHVGGLTKDVSRQIRHNQELLLGFFKAAVSLLATNGTIIVTIFDGEPYESWDLRGLAKEAGLKSQRSFKFRSNIYPGYKHARTLGNIEGSRGWKGEERPSRMYVLEVAEVRRVNGGAKKATTGEATGANVDRVINQRDAKGKKRKLEDTDSDDD